MTDHDKEVLERMGFKYYPHRYSESYQKRYRVYGRIYIFINSDNMIAKKRVETCKQAQQDLYDLRKEGVLK